VKGFSYFLKLGLFMVAMGAMCPRAGAQGFGLSVIVSANSVLVSNSPTYTINLTNLTGIGLSDVRVTNTFPTSVQIINAGFSQGTDLINSNVAVFDLGAFLAGNIAQLTVTAEPTAVGFITNAVTVSSVDITNTASTNVVIQVTNLVVLADLGVALTGPGQAVITNDLMTYGVAVTNAGPNAAPGVMLTNTLPAGVISIFPTNPSGNSNMISNLGTLANGGYTNLQFTVEPTNAGVLSLSASVGSSGVTDNNTTNNFASTNIAVTNYLSGPLGVTTNSPQTYNAQNGLVEQSISVTNTSGGTIVSARVVVAGLTNQLVNAVGTNSGNPFVYYSAVLAANQTVSLLLQYYVPTRSPFAFSNSQLSAFAVPPVVFPAPGPAAVSTNLNISRIVPLPNGNILIEWPAVTNRTYTVVYSDNVLFSNAMVAPPSITALANRLQWVDYGPPTTISVPTNAARFYRVYQNP
jgi:uncharacterized repeat protein (TIGR01451 family)